MNNDIIEMLYNHWCECNGQSEEAKKALEKIYDYCHDHHIPWNELENDIIDYAAALQYQAFSEGVKAGYKATQTD